MKVADLIEKVIYIFTLSLSIIMQERKMSSKDYFAVIPKKKKKKSRGEDIVSFLLCLTDLVISDWKSLLVPNRLTKAKRSPLRAQSIFRAR